VINVERRRPFTAPAVSLTVLSLTPHVRDYYAENGFGVLKDISVSMFGQDVATVAGPIKLQRAHMVDYYATGLFRL